jgi:hypothetical protein
MTKNTESVLFHRDTHIRRQCPFGQAQALSSNSMPKRVTMVTPFISSAFDDFFTLEFETPLTYFGLC